MITCRLLLYTILQMQAVDPREETEEGGTMMIGQAIGLTPRLTTNPRNSSSNPANISRVRSGSMWIGMRIVAHVLHTTSIVFDGLCLPLVEITGYCIFEHIGQGSHGMPIASWSHQPMHETSSIL